MPDIINPIQGATQLSLSDYLGGSLGVQSYGKIIPFFLSQVDAGGNILPFNVNVTDYDPSVTTQIEAIKFIVNPATASMNMAKLVSRTQTMTAWLEEHWGEELDTITLQGQTAAFVAGGPNLRSVRSGGGITQSLAEGAVMRESFDNFMNIQDLGPQMSESGVQVGTTDKGIPMIAEVGLTMANRNSSVSFKQMKAMLHIMRYNGVTFDSNVLTSYGQVTPPQGLPTSRNRLMLSFDFGAYLGYMESFDLTEEAQNPFRFSYTITFKSEQTIFQYTAMD